MSDSEAIRTERMAQPVLYPFDPARDAARSNRSPSALSWGAGLTLPSFFQCGPSQRAQLSEIGTTRRLAVFAFLAPTMTTRCSSFTSCQSSRCNSAVLNPQNAPMAKAGNSSLRDTARIDLICSGVKTPISATCTLGEPISQISSTTSRTTYHRMRAK